MARAIAPDLPQVEVGIRPGEKLHEEMITATDSLNTIDLGERYAILPSISFNGNRTKEEYIKQYGAKPVKEGFHYSSDTNDTWETVESIKEKIARYVDTEHII